METLDTTEASQYLGRTVASNNSDRADLYINMSKAQGRWGVVEKVLTNTGAMVHSRGIIYKAVVHTVLLYGIKSWVVTEAILKVLERSKHRLARRIARI